MIREAFLLKDSNNFEKEKEIKLNNLNSVLKKTKLSSSVLYSHIINTRCIWDEVNEKIKGRLISSLKDIFKEGNLITINEFLGNFDLKGQRIRKYTIAKDLYDIIQPYYPLFQVIDSVTYSNRLSSFNDFNDEEIIELLEYYNDYTYGYETDIIKLLYNGHLFLKYLFNRKDDRVNIDNKNNILNKLYLSYKDDFKSFDEFKMLYSSNNELNFRNSFNFSRLKFKDFLDNIFFFLNYTCQFGNEVDLKEIDFEGVTFEYIKDYFEKDKNDIINLFLLKEEGFKLLSNVFIRMINYYNEYNVIGLLDSLNNSSYDFLKSYISNSIEFNKRDPYELTIQSDYKLNSNILFACIALIKFTIKNNSSKNKIFHLSLLQLFNDLEAITNAGLTGYYGLKDENFKSIFNIDGNSTLNCSFFTFNIIRSLFFSSKNSLILTEIIDDFYNKYISNNFNLLSDYNSSKLSIKFYVFFINIMEFYSNNEIFSYRTKDNIKDIDEYKSLDLESLKVKFSQSNITRLYFTEVECENILRLDIINLENYNIYNIITIYSLFRNGISTLSPSLFSKYFKYIYNDKDLLKSLLAEFNNPKTKINIRREDLNTLNFIHFRDFEKNYVNVLNLNYNEYTMLLDNILCIMDDCIKDSYFNNSVCYLYSASNIDDIYNRYSDILNLYNETFFNNIYTLNLYLDILSSNFKLSDGTVINDLKEVMNNSYILHITLKLIDNLKYIIRPYSLESFNRNLKSYDKSKMSKVINFLEEKYIYSIEALYRNYMDKWRSNLVNISTPQEVEKEYFKIGTKSLPSISNARKLKINRFENYQYPNNKLFREMLDILILIKGYDSKYISSFFYDLFEIYLRQNEYYNGKRKNNVSLFDSELFLTYSIYLNPYDLYYIINLGYFSRIPKGSDSFKNYISTGDFGPYFERNKLIKGNSNLTLFEEAIVRNIIFNMKDYNNIDTIYEIEKQCKIRLNYTNDDDYPNYTEFIKRVVHNKLDCINHNMYYFSNYKGNIDVIFAFNTLSNFLDEKLAIEYDSNKIKESISKAINLASIKDIDNFCERIQKDMYFRYESNLYYDIREYSLKSNSYNYSDVDTLSYLGNYSANNLFGYIKDAINDNLNKPVNSNTFIIDISIRELRVYLNFHIIFNNISESIFEAENDKKLKEDLAINISNYIKEMYCAESKEEIERINNKFIRLLGVLFDNYIDDDTVISFM